MDTSSHPSAARTPDVAAPRHPVPAELLITVSADPGAASTVRDRLRKWLSAWQWPEDEADDIVLAVNEAVANVIDHAYRHHPVPGTAQIFAWTIAGAGGRRVAVSVIDRGTWRPVPVDPGHRGRGFLMMNSCMAGVHVEHGTGGTAVTMTSAPLRDGSAAEAERGRAAG